MLVLKTYINIIYKYKSIKNKNFLNFYKIFFITYFTDKKLKIKKNILKFFKNFGCIPPFLRLIYSERDIM